MCHCPVAHGTRHKAPCTCVVNKMLWTKCSFFVFSSSRYALLAGDVGETCLTFLVTCHENNSVVLTNNNIFLNGKKVNN